MQVEFTHKGWFGLCPVYLAEVHTDAPRLEPRIPFTGWLIEASAEIFNRLGAQAWPIQITGRLRPPRFIDVDG